MSFAEARSLSHGAQSSEALADDFGLEGRVAQHHDPRRRRYDHRFDQFGGQFGLLAVGLVLGAAVLLGVGNVRQAELQVRQGETTVVRDRPSRVDTAVDVDPAIVERQFEAATVRQP